MLFQMIYFCNSFLPEFCGNFLFSLCMLCNLKFNSAAFYALSKLFVLVNEILLVWAQVHVKSMALTAMLIVKVTYMKGIKWKYDIHLCVGSICGDIPEWNYVFGIGCLHQKYEADLISVCIFLV
jgi:hypothetical protein